MIKTIKFQEKVSVWQESVAQFECSADESDAETFQRLRTEGTNKSAVEWDSTRTFDDSEEAIPDDRLCSNHTLEFEDSDACGVIARDGVSCDPEVMEEEEEEEEDEDEDEDTCCTCGEPGASGDDAYDGECPECADKTDQRENPDDPDELHPGDSTEEDDLYHNGQVKL